MTSSRHQHDPSTSAPSRKRLGSTRQPFGRLGRIRGGWGRANRLTPLLAVLVVCGYLSGWLSFARPYFDPGLESPTISPVPASAVPERFSETLLKPSNPWTRPGIIRGRPPGPTKFPVGDADPERLRHVRWATVPADGIDSDYGQDGDTSLMTQLADALKEGGVPADWEWAANKTILGVGDSLMRNNVMFFADHISQWKFQREKFPLRSPEGIPWKEQAWMGVVDVPVLGLKVAQWFHQGMIEEEFDGFYTGDDRPQAFEAKLEHVWRDTINHPRGLGGRVPDLIIFESLSWDLVFFYALSRANGDSRFDGRPLDDLEIDWIRDRQINALRLLRETFPASKIVIQTAHLGAKSPESLFAPIRCIQQAEYVRSVALETGLELFDWGRIVGPLSNEMTDGLHYVAGVATWLWGEMALSYLRRAHFHPVDSPPMPPRKAKPLTQRDLVVSYAGSDLTEYSQPGISTG